MCTLYTIKELFFKLDGSISFTIFVSLYEKYKENVFCYNVIITYNKY